MRELGAIEKCADGRYELRFTRRLAAPSEEVWEALTERDSLEGWLGRVVYEPVVGSELTIDFGSGVEVRGKVLAWQPLQLFSFTWCETSDPESESVVSFELFADGAGTRLVLTHARQPHVMARSTAGGWHAHLDLLAGFLAGRTPEWDDVYPLVRAAYEGLL